MNVQPHTHELMCIGYAHTKLHRDIKENINAGCLKYENYFHIEVEL